MAIALGALVVLLVDHRIGVPSALTAGLAMQQLSGRLSAITGGIARLIESGMFIDDYQSFMALSPAAPVAAASAQAPARGHPVGVEVESVSFTYPGTSDPAIDDVSLRIEPGEVVALVGGNGSGKTTLVKLLAGLYLPDAGRISWDGEDGAPLPDAVAADLTVLFQDYLQYHLTPFDNIAFGRIERPARLADAVAAAQRAGADEFVARLPDGYRTRLGLEFEGGHELSVGQWQRLALARAFFRDGSFLILDEPTSALDPRAERDLFEQIRALSAGRSVLLITHRFSSARSADRIFVLDAGRLIESGTHEHLMAKGGHYAELFSLQAVAYLDHPASSGPSA
jgi:ATP-binding cassette subfamily B protein